MFKLKSIIPNLVESMQKGANGRIAVFGGCYEYTGAPFYSSIASLNGGADLGHVFCTKLAGQPLRSYSPEIIIHPYLISLEDCAQDDYKIQKEIMFHKLDLWLDAFQGVVIGPGLGRDSLIADYLPELVKRLNKNQIVVLDADSLWYLQKENNNIFEGVVKQNSKNIILTPNQPEFQRLWRNFMGDLEMKYSYEQKVQMIKNLHKEESGIIELKNTHPLVEDEITLSKYLGNVNILHKGYADIITNGRKCFVVCNQGSQKRCGGIGNILSGLTCLYAIWGKNNNRYLEAGEGALMGSVLASHIVRKSSQEAYRQYFYGLTAPQIIQNIGQAFIEFQNKQY